jgi:peptide/nickel transport system substrate-binding protein
MEKQVIKEFKWWEKLGKPQYGGELTIRANWNIVSFDPYNAPLGNIHSAWMETLVSDDWTVDPAVFNYKDHWRPSQYVKGYLADSWEFTDPGTYVAHLRRGIHWQDILPANGREFVADDVVFHFNRMFCLGEFVTNGHPAQNVSDAFNDLISVTAADKYTVVFKFRKRDPENIMEAIHVVTPKQCLENPEAVRKWGNLNDWHHAIGTGPFILNDFVSGASATLVKNPNYWGYDEHYTQNKLPYIDTVKYLILLDDDAAMAAMRAGKIDIMEQISPLQVQAMKRTNPEISQINCPSSNAATIDPRNDKAPFNDIRVRKAMQMAIDLPNIAKSHYGGTVEPYPAMLTSRSVQGWGFPYEQWPQDLKDEYAYNPMLAKKLLAEAGYPEGFDTNIIVEDTADIALLQIVKSYFARIGIDMKISKMASTDWADFVEIGHKHDQLAHRSAGPLGHGSSTLHDLTRFRKGSHVNWAMVDDPGFNSFLPKAMAITTVDGRKQVMRDANEYIARQHFTISLLQPKAYSLCQPWVKGFNAQFGSAWAHAGGPAKLSFYLARFWIDRDLKKRMGH